MSDCSRFRWFGLNALTLLALAGLTTACNGQSGLADGDSAYTESTVGEDELGEGTIDTSLEGQESELGIVPIAPSSPSHAAVESESAEASPLEELMVGRAGPRTEDDIQEWRAEENRKIEERAQSCMAKEGWEYEVTPLLDAAMFESVPVIGTKTGYGYYESVDLGLWLNDPAKVEQATAGRPNHDYFESLTPDEREQWFAASSECLEEASLFYAVKPPAIMSSVEGFDLDAELELLDQRIANDPRLVEAWLVWSRCMSGEGFEFENRERIFQQLDRQVEVFDSIVASGATGLPSDLKPKFAAFRDNEVEIKEADLLCADQVENVERVVRIDLELEFIEEFGLSRAR